MNLFTDALQWLGDGTNWTGATGILHRLLQHLSICLAVIGIATVIALPVGIAVGHSRRGGGVIIALAGAVRAIPTLGLLSLLALWLGIGLQAPVIALIILAIPSLLAGAYSGVEAVDCSTVDSSRAIGMTPWQIVRQVELPLAAPVILGGLRVALLQVVATATLAAYVSDTGLGRFLFTGLKSRDYAQMLGGALLVAALAILLEVTLSAIQLLASRRHQGSAASLIERPI